eukprot:gene8240-11152_t
MSSMDEEIQPITSQEEKEIRRVFELLCNYHSKGKLKEEIKELNTWIQSYRKNSNQNQHHVVEDPNLLTTVARVEELKKELSEIESKSDKICVNDISEILKKLKKKVSRKEIEEMIWEVDENLDGFVDWTEFRLMFNRNILDKTGLEPNGMYHLAQFLIYDINGNGRVSVDETMNILYARYGRAKMEMKLKELFGEDMHETGRQGGEITFSSYLASVEKTQMSTFLNTTKGKIVASKGFGKGLKNKIEKNGGH